MKPPALKPGQKIGVFAPSSYVEKSDIEKSKAVLEKRGYEVFIHPQTYERLNQSAGTHLQKALAFQGLWQRDDIDVLWAAGGGNRCLHLLESLNFKALKAKSKILIGFSDVTALLTAVYTHTGLTVFHGPVFKNLHRYGQLDHCLNLLGGKNAPYPAEDFKVISEGAASGPLIGGNLSIFQYLPQMLPGAFWRGAILFLEDCNEELSKIDRMFLYLKRTGILENTAGLICGQFTEMRETGRPYGFTLPDIVREHTENFDIPVIMNAPFGHGQALFTLPVGHTAVLTTSPPGLKLEGPAVTV